MNAPNPMTPPQASEAAVGGPTPGPWKLVPGGDTTVYDGRGEPVIGKGAFLRRGHQEAWANLNLAATAPELLAALEMYVAVVGNTGYAMSRESAAELYARAQAVIAKAKAPTP